MNQCELCQAPKAAKSCAECGRAACKNCLCFLEQDKFRFHPEPPAFATKGIFCFECFESLVKPEVERYDEVLARSEKVTLIPISYRGYVACLRKAQYPTEVEAEAGKGIAVWKLKFLAAWQGYDAIVDLEAENRKTRNAGWESKVWNAKGLFVALDHAKFRPPPESF